MLGEDGMIWGGISVNVPRAQAAGAVARMGTKRHRSARGDRGAVDVPASCLDPR